jgi:hypothetical protein
LLQQVFFGYFFSKSLKESPENLEKVDEFQQGAWKLREQADGLVLSTA